MSIPMSPEQVLDRYFLEMRCKVLDVAAALDRIDRAGDSAKVAADGRMQQLREAVDTLRTVENGRAERVQRIFSLAYDPEWVRPRLGE